MGNKKGLGKIGWGRGKFQPDSPLKVESGCANTHQIVHLTALFIAFHNYFRIFA
jgi:hypothetical protein